MTDSKFRQALFEVLMEDCEKAVPYYEKAHDFSDEFKKKMQKLINNQKKPYYPLIKTTGRKIVAIIVAAALMGAIVAAAVYYPAKKANLFKVKDKTTFSEIQSNDADNPEAPKTIEQNYDITYNLSEYDIYYEDYNSYSRTIVYQKENTVIDYCQYTKEMFDFGVNTEGAEMLSENINGFEAMYFVDNQNYHHLIWDNGEYVIMINTNLSKSELIEIAQSVQKVE